MNEMQSSLDRLERRIEDQAERIDALYGLLELRGILPHATDAGRGDGLFEDESEGIDPSCGWHDRPRPKERRPTRLRVGTATGV
jgi:hypothetical protein